MGNEELRELNDKFKNLSKREPMTDTDLRKGLEEVIKLSRSDTCAVCNYFDDGELAQSILTYLKENNLLGE